MSGTPMAEILDAIRLLGRQDVQRPVVLGVVYSGHTSGDPRIVFDGETTASTKAYPRSVNVTAGDRVWLIRAGSTYIVAGLLL